MEPARPDQQNSARVFVGNIPPFASEEELASELSVFGPVVSFKLIVDKNTGRHKGYGFCQFRDHETALSAVRNQKGLLCQGRQLRVGTAHFAQEHRKSATPSGLAEKIKPAAPIKQQKNEPRELDVFALRQLMKLRQAMATKSNPLKREHPSSEGSADTAKHLKKLSLDTKTTKNISHSTASDAIPAKHKASPTSSGSKTTELDNLDAPMAIPDRDMQHMHADLITLLHLLNGANASTSHCHQYNGHLGTAPLPIHQESSFRVAFAA